MQSVTTLHITLCIKNKKLVAKIYNELMASLMPAFQDGKGIVA